MKWFFVLVNKVIHLAHGLGEIVRIEEKKDWPIAPLAAIVFCAKT